MPTTQLTEEEIETGVGLLDLLLRIGLIPSKGEGRRLMQQNGLSLNGQTVQDVNRRLEAADLANGEAIIRKGKKIYHRVTGQDI
jgi:tyrosyl-tRNA synthetase